MSYVTLVSSDAMQVYPTLASLLRRQQKQHQLSVREVARSTAQPSDVTIPKLSTALILHCDTTTAAHHGTRYPDDAQVADLVHRALTVSAKMHGTGIALRVADHSAASAAALYHAVQNKLLSETAGGVGVRIHTFHSEEELAQVVHDAVELALPDTAKAFEADLMQTLPDRGVHDFCVNPAKFLSWIASCTTPGGVQLPEHGRL
ncbi:hypothetical protein RI367_004694 [Sorochytrium milnesiophthora]